MKELPENILWLQDADNSRYINKYERKAFELGEVATFFDYDEDGYLDYDSAVTVRVVEDEVLGLVGRLV